MMKNTISTKLKKIPIERLVWGITIAISFFFVSRAHLLSDSLDIDEILTWNWFTGSWTNLWGKLIMDTQSFVYYVLIKFFHIFVSLDNDYWLRVPSLILGSIAIGMWSYYWHKKYYLKPVLVVFFVLLLGFNPLFQYISTYARSYILAFILISFLAIRISMQIKYLDRVDTDFPERSIKLSYWEVVTACLLINVHHLGAIWFSGLLVTSIFLKLKIDWGHGKSSVFKKAITIFSIVFFIWSFVIQWQNRHLMLWSMDFLQHPEQIMGQVFGYGSYLWLILIITMLILDRAKLSFNFRFWLFHLAFILSVFLIALSFSINLFIFRYLSIVIPTVLILQEEVFVWIYELKSFFRIIYLWLPLAAAYVIYAPNLKFPQRYGPKNMFVALRNQGSINADTRVACLIKSENLLRNYSLTYFKRDICSEYWRTMDVKNLNNFDFLIVLSHDNINRPSGFNVPAGWTLKDQSSELIFLYKKMDSNTDK